MSAVRLAAAAAVTLAAWLAAAAPSGAWARSPADVQGAEQRFVATAAGLRRELSRRRELPPEAQERLRDVQFVYRRAARPEARPEHRFGAVQVTVSDGWMLLAEQLLSASRLPQGGCALAYVRSVAEVERANRRLVAEGRRTGLRAWPLLRAHLEDSDDPTCRGEALHELRLPRHTDAVAAGLDAALAWTILRQLAALPCTLPPPAAATAASASAASAATAGPAVAAGCRPADAHAAALAWARVLERDLRPAAPAVLADLAWACRSACDAGWAAYRRHLEPATPPGAAGDPAWAGLATWPAILAPSATPDPGSR